MMAQIHEVAMTETGLKADDANDHGQARPIEEMFNIKGPMGVGLQMKPSGLHVAFCAGTGALVFLDLVAHILMRNVF